ncbi:DUF1629 domain-containing protein [Citrobacter farmeri]|uniref:imm11 family protein n=2 Tax=Citrobacter farmeri TaxID=67824 RepID=UPI001CEC04C7|nr:DUF1629 domain-containing protein [Citrobacter farmeri]
MMSYILSVEHNTFNMISYLHDISVDYSLFNEGISLKALSGKLVYKVKNKSGLNKLKKCHIISTTGPDLVSNDLKEVLTSVAPNEVEFFNAEIFFENKKIEGFSVINPTVRVDCCNMEKSEYKITNFDPKNPTYMFSYTVLLEEIPHNLNVVRCNERHGLIVVSERIKQECINAKLKGLQFCKSIDMTYNNRSDCEKI